MTTNPTAKAVFDLTHLNPTPYRSALPEVREGEDQDMTWSFDRTRRMSAIIHSLEDLIERTRDYFDDELTAQLNVTKTWLEESKTTIRSPELERIKLAREITRIRRLEPKITQRGGTQQVWS
jgi:hypothetical protein